MSEAHEITCTWQSEMAFKASVDGFDIMVDAKAEFGGKDRGPTPKPLTLVSLAGCTGMDVISILGKMKIGVDYFNVRVSGQLTDDHPKYYQAIHLVYEFRGNDLPLSKLQRAVELSQDKYCGVSAMLRKGTELTYEIKILA